MQVNKKALETRKAQKTSCVFSFHKIVLNKFFQFLLLFIFVMRKKLRESDTPEKNFLAKYVGHKCGTNFPENMQCGIMLVEQT